jgi:hypothetical protein
VIGFSILIPSIENNHSIYPFIQSFHEKSAEIYKY